MGFAKNLLLVCIGFSLSLNTVSADISTNVDDLRFLYYPSPTQQIEILYNNTVSLKSAALKVGVTTVVVIDGFLSNSTTPMSVRIKDSYTSFMGATTNLILVDWGKLSGSGVTLCNPLSTFLLYTQACQNVGPIGERIADFLNFLQQNQQLQLSGVIIVGHSLGAHVAGAAGLATQSKYNTTIKRISGLDPAGPYTSLTAPKLAKGAASFVDIYHTNAGVLGDVGDLGDINVYVNGGTSQPGCEEVDVTQTLGYCSHSYSWKIFSMSFNNTITACTCALTCNCKPCPNVCVLGGVTIGPNIDTTKSGRYRTTYGPLN